MALTVKNRLVIAQNQVALLCRQAVQTSLPALFANFVFNRFSDELLAVTLDQADRGLIEIERHWFFIETFDQVPGDPKAVCIGVVDIFPFTQLACYDLKSSAHD